MIEINEAIKAKDRQALSVIFHYFTERQAVSEDLLIEIINNTLPSILSTFTNVYVFTFKGTEIKSYEYESLIWQIGETFRQTLTRNKTLRNSKRLFDAIEQVVLDRKYGRGRESFVMLFGQYKKCEYISTLVSLLDDPDVNGHSVYSLRLIGDPLVKEKIRPFLDCPKTWVRNEARKYFAKIEK